MSEIEQTSETKQKKRYGSINRQLFIACRDGDLEKTKALIGQEANVMAKDNRGQTPLHIAVLNGRSEIVKLLIENKVDVNARNKNGQAPLDLAIRCMNADMVKLLIDRGAKPIIISIDNDIEGYAAKNEHISPETENEHISPETRNLNEIMQLINNQKQRANLEKAKNALESELGIEQQGQTHSK